jgi:hypothetical protein
MPVKPQKSVALEHIYCGNFQEVEQWEISFYDCRTSISKYVSTGEVVGPKVLKTLKARKGNNKKIQHMESNM